MQHETVKYWSGGVECAADVHIPDHDGPLPALVIGHGFNQTREALKEEARYFSEAGFAVMAIDYRGYGDSEGEPRNHINPRRQSEDVRNAITYFSRRPEVDEERIGIWGVSFGGGLVIHVAAFDRRVKAVVSQSPIVNGRRWIREVRSRFNYQALRQLVEDDFAERHRPNPVPEKRLVDGGPGPDLTAVYMDELPDPDTVNPENVVANPMAQSKFDPMITIASVERVMDFNPEDCIDMIAPRPLLVIANDARDSVHQIEHIQDAFKKAGEPKRMVVLPRDMNDLYEEPGRGEAMGLCIEFFREHL